MLQYRGMKSMCGRTEFICCGDITLDQVQRECAEVCGTRGVPVAFKNEKIKGGFMNADPCLVMYNPQNLDYHVYVFVIRCVNGQMMLSWYSAGTASVLHIGGGITNVDNWKSKGIGLLKSAKQKEAEQTYWINETILGIEDALVALGIVDRSFFS